MDNFEKKLESLFKATKSSNIRELAEVLGVSQTTVRTWRSRGKIPESAIRKAGFSTYQSMNDSQKITIDEMKSSLMEGLFTAIQLKGITVQDGIKIGDVADILMTELQENYPSIFTEEKTKTG